MVDVTHKISCSTINMILKNKTVGHVKSTVPMMWSIVLKKHGKVIKKTEKLLSV